MDITEIDAASNNGVDNIRALREEVYFTPTAGKYRVYIIDEVHMLSVGAFNALLKTLEEPPEHVIFILATTEVHKIPATVLSRCQRFDFQRISDHAIAARLQYVAKNEGFVLEKDAAHLIARLADGGMRDALSILDRCAGAETVDIGRVNQIVGLASNHRLHALAHALAEGDMADALSQVDELHRNSSDITRLCDQLITHFRNLMLAKAVSNPEGLIVCSPEDLRGYMNGAEDFTLEEILAVLTALQNARERMRGAVNQRVELEMALIRLSSPSTSVTMTETVVVSPKKPAVESVSVASPAKPKEPSVVQEQPAPPEPQKVDLPWYEDDQKQILKNEDTAQKYREEIPPFTDEDCPPEEPYDAPVVPSAPPVAPPPAVPKEGNGLPYFTSWAAVIEQVAKKSMMMASVLKKSDAYLKEDIILIRSQHPQFVDLLRQQQNRKVIKEAITAVTGQSYRLGPYTEETAAPKEDPLLAFVKNLQGKEGVTNLDAVPKNQE
jgi:DNA polymerase-3 subunit gamma/tau